MTDECTIIYHMNPQGSHESKNSPMLEFRFFFFQEQKTRNITVIQY